MKFKVCYLAWAGGILSLFGFIGLCFYPVRDSLIRISILAVLTILWLSVLGIVWARRKLRRIYLGLTAAFILFLCMPSRQINEGRFRVCYAHCLERYESVPYLWGAESLTAIDCSGLIRQGYIDALWIYGLKTFNGALVREGLLLWMRDCSAKAMRDGFRSRTKKFMEARNINSLDGNQLEPGDFAVTQNGVHCLAYLGDDKWIQADPAAKKVVINHVPATDCVWYEAPVYVMRWSTMK